MKKGKISLYFLTFSIMSLTIFPNYSFTSTILGESTFPAEVGNDFIWETVNATESWYMEVEYVRFTVDSIYNSTYLDNNYLFMNYTLEYYHRFSWVPQYINSFYMAYNKSLNFLNWSSEGFYGGNLFIFPTPVNYTLIQEAIEIEGYINTSREGNKLILDYGNTTFIEHTIDPSGISSIIEKITNGTTIFKWELNTEDVIIRIPFGNGFIVFSLTFMLFLVIIYSRKLKRIKNE